MSRMCVLYVSVGSKLRPRTFECVVMGSAVLFSLRSRLLVSSAWSGGNRVKIVSSGFRVRLLCFFQEKLYICMVVCIYLRRSCLSV